MNILTDTSRQSLTLEELNFQKKYKDKGIEIIPPAIAFKNGDYDYEKRREVLKTLSVNHLLIIDAANKSGMCVVAENFIFKDNSAFNCCFYFKYNYRFNYCILF